MIGVHRWSLGLTSGLHPRSASALVVVVSVVAVLSGCASAPAYRPVGPPLASTWEAGGGLHGVVGQETAGTGVAGWLTGQVAKDIMLVGRGHVSTLFPYRGGADLARDLQFGGSVGLRGVYTVKPGLLLGGEVLVDYMELRDSTSGVQQQFASLVASVPVAEEAFENIWVYAQPTIGAGFRFGDVDVPFGGFTEVPIGVAWQASEHLMLIVEGGLAIPFNGGYGGVAASWRW
jgi:hypothetical protein